MTFNCFFNLILGAEMAFDVWQRLRNPVLSKQERNRVFPEQSTFRSVGFPKRAEVAGRKTNVIVLYRHIPVSSC